MPFESLVTIPVLFGKSPTRLGVIKPVLAVTDAVGARMSNGDPDVQLKIPPNCQRSTSRFTIDGALPKSAWFGPKGSSHVPLLRIALVRWNVSNALSMPMFRGLR